MRITIRPHRLHATNIDAAYCYRYRTQRGLCVCVLGTLTSCAKTAEPIEMPFRVVTWHVGPRNHYTEELHSLCMHVAVACVKPRRCLKSMKGG